MYIPEERHACHSRCGFLRLPGLGGLRVLHTTRDEHPHSTPNRSGHQHDLYHVVAYTSGTGSCIVGNRTVPVASPFLVLISPGIPHSFSRLPGEDCVYQEVTFAPQRPGSAPDWSGLLSLWSGESCVVPTVGPCSPACAEDVAAIAGRMASYGHADHQHTAALLQGLLAELLFSLFRHLVADIERAAPPDALDVARAFIERHAEDPIDLGSVARASGLSAKHLGRIFAARMGMPPMRYRRQVLMRRAAVLLRSSDAPVEHIAQQLGFSDWRYFSRCFRAEHGRPPKSYRRS